MKALLIDPQSGQVSAVWFDPQQFPNYIAAIEYLLGGKFHWEFDFENGDSFFTSANAIFDKSALAFSLNSTNSIYFGKALIASLPPPTYKRLRSPKQTILGLSTDVFFFDYTISHALRKAKLSDGPASKNFGAEHWDGWN